MQCLSLKLRSRRKKTVPKSCSFRHGGRPFRDVHQTGDHKVSAPFKVWKSLAYKLVGDGSGDVPSKDRYLLGQLRALKLLPAVRALWAHAKATSALKASHCSGACSRFPAPSMCARRHNTQTVPAAQAVEKARPCDLLVPQHSRYRDWLIDLVAILHSHEL